MHTPQPQLLELLMLPTRGERPEVAEAPPSMTSTCSHTACHMLLSHARVQDSSINMKSCSHTACHMLKCGTSACASIVLFRISDMQSETCSSQLIHCSEHGKAALHNLAIARTPPGQQAAAIN